MNYEARRHNKYVLNYSGRIQNEVFCLIYKSVLRYLSWIHFIIICSWFPDYHTSPHTSTLQTILCTLFLEDRTKKRRSFLVSNSAAGSRKPAQCSAPCGSLLILISHWPSKQENLILPYFSHTMRLHSPASILGGKGACSMQYNMVYVSYVSLSFVMKATFLARFPYTLPSPFPHPIFFLVS